MLLDSLLLDLPSRNQSIEAEVGLLCILIDVGGTNIDVFEIYSGYICRQPRIVHGGKAINTIIKAVITEARMISSDIDIVVGLPGPVSPRQDSVYCPPLSKTIEFGWMLEKGIYVVNDAAGHALFLLSTPRVVVPSCIVTIGTSLGLSVIESEKKKGLTIGEWLDQSVNSYEIAHEPLGDYSSVLDRNSLRIPFQHQTDASLCSVFSMAGLQALLHGESVAYTQDKIPIASCETLAEGFKVGSSSGHIFESWLHCLHEIMQIYLKGKVKKKCTSYIIGGGLSRIAFNSKYQCLIDRIFP